MVTFSDWTNWEGILYATIEETLEAMFSMRSSAKML
jgi:hypothetical protein